LVAAVLALLAMAAPASAGEELLTYLTKGKIKIGKRMDFQVVCSADCQVTSTTTVVLPGRDLGPIQASDVFAAGEVAESFLKPNKPARQAMAESVGKSKLRTSVLATNIATGETDTDKRTFKLKR
jgi:hypothetical protein